MFQKKCSIAICRMEKNSSSNGSPQASTSSFRSAVPPSVLPDPQTAPGNWGWLGPLKNIRESGDHPVLVKKIEHVTTLRLLLTNMLKIWSPGTETNPKAWWTKAETWPWERWDPSLSFLGQETKDQHVTDILVQNTMAIMIGPWQWRKRWTKRFFRFEYIAHQFKSYKDADDFPPSRRFCHGTDACPSALWPSASTCSPLSRKTKSATCRATQPAASVEGAHDQVTTKSLPKRWYSGDTNVELNS